MEYYDKEYGLELWGDYACFTHQAFKVERVSYDVITPSAARNIFQAIFWKPAIQWQITRIEVINPIKKVSIRRNEVGAVGAGNANASPIVATEKRQQKNTIMLKDVRYRIYAKMVYVPPCKRPGKGKHDPGKDENPAKYQAMFERRAAEGQCFSRPYLGTRECAAEFRLLGENDKNAPDLLQESKNFGIMLYDLDYSDPENPSRMFFNAIMNNGVIEVPSPDSEEVMR